MIYLQLSTGQSPAECQIFARFALRQILREAETAGVAAELLSQTASKHGILSAVFALSGAGGKGGQHVNKTDSAVRATHLATGVSVRVESGRSQHANKKRARELLALKLAEQHSAALGQHAANAHSQLYQVARGNPVRVFKGADFREQPAA